MSDASWTLAELTRRVGESLASDEAPPNGQVRAVPDERSVRYYTTLGLIDRPHLRGRTALYGIRQLAQVVAVKRLQTAGQSLAAIQRLLPTLDDAELAKVSGVALRGPRRASTRTNFWRAPDPSTTAAAAAGADADADAAADAAAAAAAAFDADATPAPDSASATPPHLQLNVTLTLAPGVILTIPLPPSRRVPTGADADAVVAAAAPLLAELARRRLT